jgi:hypothetical protein
MESAREQPTPDATLTCPGCGQLIGVYEPIVHVVAGIAHKTSRAADPHLAQSRTGACYHLACWELGDTDLVAL